MSDVQEPPVRDTDLEANAPREHDRPSAKSGWPMVKLDQLAARATGLSGAQRLATAVSIVLSVALGVGIWRHYQVHAWTYRGAEQ